MRLLLIRTLYHIKISGIVYYLLLECTTVFLYVMFAGSNGDGIHRTTGFWIILNVELIGDNKNLYNREDHYYNTNYNCLC